jgi:hypothetical protein
MKKKKPTILPSPKPFDNLARGGRALQQQFMAAAGRFLTAATTQQWATSLHAAISNSWPGNPLIPFPKNQ